MTVNIEDLKQRINELVSAADRRLKDQMRQTADEAEAQQKRFRLFNELASGVLKDEIGVRLNHLAGYFPHTNIDFVDVVGKYSAICRFRHTARFPASVDLRFSCAHDDCVEQLLCSYDLELLPVFIKYEKHDEIATPIESLERSFLSKWLDEKIVKFLETYLQLEFIDQYQQENHVTDPVSQARLNRVYAAAETNYKGKTYYFLSDQNRKFFEASPEQFVHA